eukprot:10582718-Alexandrium_andersonii.AAC.1
MDIVFAHIRANHKHTPHFTLAHHGRDGHYQCDCKRLRPLQRPPPSLPSLHKVLEAGWVRRSALFW